ncbi:MAG: TetR/AcrR family transcriptional regulator [Deltaproteobacteria bacterium]|nr:TetR/AcrR family transcriptional regulator [Deltaproteobacteria bacterium]
MHNEIAAQQQTTPRPRKEGRVQQRQRILDALFAVMSSSGAGGASVSEIVEAAGISRGALHYYFESKDELVAALMQRLGDGYLARMTAFLDREEAASSSSSCSLGCVPALVRWHFSGDSEEATRLLGVWIDFWGQAPSRKDIGDVVFAVQETARALCSRALVLQRPELAALGDDVLRAHGASLLAIVEGGLLQWRIAISSPRPFDRCALGQALADVAAAFVLSLSVSPSLERR